MVYRSQFQCDRALAEKIYPGDELAVKPPPLNFSGDNQPFLPPLLTLLRHLYRQSRTEIYRPWCWSPSCCHPPISPLANPAPLPTATSPPHPNYLPLPKAGKAPELESAVARLPERGRVVVAPAGSWPGKCSCRGWDQRGGRKVVPQWPLFGEFCWWMIM